MKTIKYKQYSGGEFVVINPFCWNYIYSNAAEDLLGLYLIAKVHLYVISEISA